MEKILNLEKIAHICYDANKALAEATDDPLTFMNWEDLSQPTINEWISGVQYYLDNGDVDPEKYHTAWMRQMQRESWVYGEEFNEEKKTHPNIVPYGVLNSREKIKPMLFRSIVKSMSQFLPDL